MGSLHSFAPHHHPDQSKSRSPLNGQNRHEPIVERLRHDKCEVKSALRIRDCRKRNRLMFQ